MTKLIDDNFIVAMVGRPNVGKSTLFNRLVGRRIAIETPIAGTTRDQLFGVVSWRGHEFSLIDLAGIETKSKSEMDQNIQENIQEAIANADLIIFMVDWTEKDNEKDIEIARMLRKSAKKILLTVNKSDNTERIRNISEFGRLGFETIPVSAISGKNTGDLLDKVIENLPKRTTACPAKLGERSGDDTIKLSIIGRPNVGKSTLVNSIVEKKRAVVSSVPGTTRDAVDIIFDFEGKKIDIIDTAGIRRPGKIGWDTIEKFSVLRSYKALRDSDITILVIDAEEGLVANDAHILGTAKEWGKGIILAVNKIDIWGENIEQNIAQKLTVLQEKLNFVPWLPVVFISAQNQENIKVLLRQVLKVYQNRQTEIPQRDLDLILEHAKSQNGQLQGVKSLIQKRTSPPTFELFLHTKKPLHFSQVRFLENKIRDQYPMEGSPIFIDLVSINKTKRR